ncbi:signal peptidase II [Stratiformator vulcanicus]|uniref:Lipoprotein signal peptidase n=1 Tax=Stratiformator vulcanicus TaxID=2527980 RepID=A0A517R6B9_9PLAN|nr:signal peptidase II [Stratiformator vulcanicus]QDT39436.1 Lipoprotein signal peptidase [Stratiformator vulcanicus]
MNSLPANRYAIFACLAIFGLAADLVSKNVVFAQLGSPAGSTGWLIDSWLKFRLFTTFNEGALWGFGQGLTSLFAVFSIAAAAGVIYWLFVAKAAKSLWLTISLALVMAGTLGNLFDRFGLHGLSGPDGEVRLAVRDFLHFRFGTFDWAVFNVADILLVVGAIMLGLQSLMPDPAQAKASSDKEPPGDVATQAA